MPSSFLKRTGDQRDLNGMTHSFPTRRSSELLPDHPDHALGRKLMPRGCGSIVSFGVKGGRKAGAKFIEACRLASHLANVGDAKTLVIHPASTTHQQMTAEQLQASGVGEDMVRLSVGLEDPDDIAADLRQE